MKVRERERAHNLSSRFAHYSKSQIIRKLVKHSCLLIWQTLLFKATYSEFMHVPWESNLYPWYHSRHALPIKLWIEKKNPPIPEFPAMETPHMLYSD